MDVQTFLDRNDQKVFEKILTDYRDFITRLQIPDLHCIPLSALKGDNVVGKSTSKR